MRTTLISIAVALSLMSGVALAGSKTSSQNFDRDQALSQRNIQEGVVLMVREVRIEDRSKVNTGTFVGGAVGAAIGDRTSRKNRDTRNVARVVGAAGGALIGGAAQRAVSGHRGYEIVVRTQDRRGRSEVISIVQDADVSVRQGQSVLISGSGRDVRVVPIPDAPISSL
ncbi:TPA: glycine zipper 2TM domain-containing protein [Stenotrophomonas maltophilia]|uniref:glycine zipper 2TM domain-containing protein n=1 Tax=unclassified Stenotrophomonas TaxID=196198 RepID=UPI00244B439A|nr:MULTISPECIES: glycine zipper 2TM domain-containing protein [unclassified Stenotrophomonas]HDS1363575.1 glycine zipper 2TM domain-containing protein [Stenotrophomonas maltophilia]MDH0190153.1 glycine zipper 2TM domain-containing protein [Stenotrophomonas sp. GD04051]MDH0463941.1 glycine zipper 2TM domain-containing protein [Stenotrophomonas sp. GD03993]MDH0874563.1 glycine zipper 2TM domain-containing protein [Stenotrophomonas sp. GD03877]MDH2155152.1 glycine zipper 2TM domain-containing pro